ncbi:MAG: hypothetical protein RQ826_13955 [Xanthomonadales bacterium]|nr:hypothetical protein [Xanthomonadales bacterium]
MGSDLFGSSVKAVLKNFNREDTHKKRQREDIGQLMALIRKKTGVRKPFLPAVRSVTGGGCKKMFSVPGFKVSAGFGKSPLNPLI